MKKIFISLTLVLLLVLVAASTVTAAGKTPFGGPRGNVPMRGKVINLATLPAGVTTNVHMIADFGYCTDLQATRSGDLVLMAGVMWMPNGGWGVFGEALIVKQKIAAMVMEVTNPYADGCVGAWVDSVNLYGSSLVNRYVGGTWENICVDVVTASGPWMGAFYKGACPTY